MNVPKQYNDEAERLWTHPLLLPKEDVPCTIYVADKAVLDKTNDKISFMPRVLFAQKITTTRKTSSLGDRAEATICNGNLRKLTGVRRLFTGVGQTPFSPYVPGNLKLEPDDAGGVPPPLIQRLVDNDSSDGKNNDEDNIVVEDVDSDDEEILEEALSEGWGHHV